MAMNPPTHNFHELFAQLGLPDDAAHIRQFIAANKGLTGAVGLADAPFWSPAQAAFLCEALQEDSDWAEVADQLSTALRL
jgi:hypothetical protein